MIGAGAHDIESTVLFRGADIEVACHRELLGLAVFGHFREEARELDKIARDFVGFEYFVTFDISEVFAVGLVLDFKILCRDVADFVAVRCGIYFELVIFVGEIGFGYVNWYAAQALVQYLIMNPRRIYGDSRTALRMRIHSKNESWNVGENDPTKSVGQANIDAVDGEFELAVLVCF